MSNSDDMESINRYFSDTEAVTQSAIDLKDKWIEWYNGLGWYDRNFDQGSYDEARNLRNSFNLANVKSHEELQGVKDVIAKGLTSEEQQAQARRINSKGQFPKKPFFSTPVKIYFAVLVALGVAVAANAVPAAVLKRK